jgi:hypothetical protein
MVTVNWQVQESGANVGFRANLRSGWRGGEGQLRVGLTSSIDAGPMAGIGASPSLPSAPAKVR